MSNQRFSVTGDKATLLDSCVRIRLQVAPSLLGQLSAGAQAALNDVPAHPNEAANIILQADKNKFTIKPTLTFEDGDAGVTGVVILEVEPKK